MASTRRPRWVASFRACAELGRGTAPDARQTAVTGAWLLAMLVTASARTGTTELPDARLTVAVLAAWAPLLARTYRPALALLGTLVAESMILTFVTVPDDIAALTEGMGAYQPAPLATMLAVATLAARVPRRTGWTAGVVAGGWLAAVGLTVNDTDTVLTDLVVFYLVVTAAAVGVWWSGRRERAERAAAEAAARTEQAVLDERLRIARELHDVLAHNLTLVNAQAGVASFLMTTDAHAAQRALQDITRHTARAIDDLRATIGLLRGRDEDGPGSDLRPLPGVAAIGDLVDVVAATGTEVRVTESGRQVTLDQQVDLAAYRIVQEAVTNAAKHAPAASVDVTLTWAQHALRLRVRNAMPSPRPTRRAAPGTGHGLIGMRERATSVGGTFRAGPLPGDQFEVVATLPTAPTPPDPGVAPRGAQPDTTPETDPR